MKCFDQIRIVRLDCLINLKELVYPKIMEFFTHLEFEKNSLKGKMFLQGAKSEFTERHVASLLDFKATEKTVCMIVITMLSSEATLRGKQLRCSLELLVI